MSYPPPRHIHFPPKEPVPFCASEKDQGPALREEAKVRDKALWWCFFLQALRGFIFHSFNLLIVILAQRRREKGTLVYIRPAGPSQYVSNRQGIRAAIAPRVFLSVSGQANSPPSPPATHRHSLHHLASRRTSQMRRRWILPMS